ncbi:hypothetical protein [Pleionea sp. CnH1-48]|uniref:hypothetical protein n=1 Tax=Pleionea sp. CnH1-48 TaxID=2954494 RepID=UPI002097BF63|nr:hypothetical protein [Pleionea sp. CnH1-48]MCO7225921.1 hypothetical protein [Pleionea sp. CnH1-48]
MNTQQVDVSDIVNKMRGLLSRFAAPPIKNADQAHCYFENVKVQYSSHSSVVDFSFETQDGLEVSIALDFNEVFKESSYIERTMQKLVLCLEDARRNSQEQSRIVLH